MTSHDLLATMHAVLDGEASAEETRMLELRLAADPAARVEFEGLQRLFRALENVPKEHAPEGLVAAVTAALPAPAARNVRQLFPGSRVFGHASPKTATASPPGNAAFERPTRLTGITTGSNFMTEQTNKTIGNRKTWFGIGIAAAALVVVAQFGFDFPLGKDVSGTIVPAQRYRAEPNGSEAVKLVTPAAGTAAIETPTAATPLQAQAEKQTQAQAERMSQAQAEKQAQAQADRMSQAQAEKQTQAQAERMSQAQAEKQTQAQAARMSQAQAEKQTQAQAERMSQVRAEKAAQAQQR